VKRRSAPTSGSYLAGQSGDAPLAEHALRSLWGRTTASMVALPPLRDYGSMDAQSSPAETLRRLDGATLPRRATRCPHQPSVASVERIPEVERPPTT
jgi:hypothetical protein